MWNKALAKKIPVHLGCMKGYLQSDRFIEKVVKSMFCVNESPFIVRLTSKVNTFLGSYCG